MVNILRPKVVKATGFSNQVIGNNNVAVPTHFYKIIIDSNDPNDIKILAFLIPNENLTGREYSEFLTSVDEIERLTGLDFLRNLPDQVESQVESKVALNVW